MGFTGLALAILLALAVPASIAGTSLVGAYVVLAVLGTVVALLAYHRRRSLLPAVVVVLVVYAVVVELIHLMAA